MSGPRSWTDDDDLVGVECIYKEKAAPGLRAGYGKDVERRLAALEANYERVEVLLRQNNNPQPGAHVLNFNAAGSSMNDDSIQNHQTDVALSLLPATGPQTTTSTSPAAIMNPMDAIMLGALPPSEVLVELANMFFEIVHPWAPLFHKPTFMANLFAPNREVLVRGLIVVTFRYWTRTTPSLQVRDAYVNAARNQILLHCADTCSIVSTQALALLGIDALGQSLGTRLWNIMSMLSASIQQLALTREPLSSTTQDPETPMVGNDCLESEVGASFVVTEERRRLFWTIFNLDRFGSVALGQAGSITLGSIKLRYPTNAEGVDWTTDATVGPWYDPTDSIKMGPHSPPWSCYIELLSLLDRSNRLLIRPFDLSLRVHREEWQCNFRMLEVTLNTWLENAPRQCRNPLETPEPMWTAIRATFEL